MKKAHRFVPEHAWSPLGYQIVETAEKTAPRQPEQQPARRQDTTYPFEQEDDATPTERARPKRRRLRARPVKSNNLFLLWLCIPVGLLGMFFVVGIILFNTQPRPPRLQPIAAVDPLPAREVVIPDFGDIKLPPREVVIPDAPKDKKVVAAKEEKPAQKAGQPKPQPAVVANLAPAAIVCDPPADGMPADNNFGTSVQFVRNVDAAQAKAAKQHKLVFVMHVSGNFEDAQFT